MTQKVNNKWLLTSVMLFGLYCLNVAVGKIAIGSGSLLIS